MFIVKSATAPACYRPGEFDTAQEAEARLIEAGYHEVNHPSGRVFIKPIGMNGSRSICRVVEK